MWLFEADGGKKVFGFQLIDFEKETVQASPALIESFFRDMVVPAFGEKHQGRFPTMECYPVPGHPERAWVVLLADEENPEETAPPFPLHFSWHSRLQDDPWTAREVRVAVGQITMGGGWVVGPFRIRTSLSEQGGIFRFRSGVLEPGGNLHLPGFAVSVDARVRAVENIMGNPHRRLQGFWQDDSGSHPVFGFHAFLFNGSVLPLHPRQDMKDNPWKTHSNDGFLVWGDGRHGLALWAISHDFWGSGCLELVDTRTGEIVWRAHEVSLASIASLPDGRWAAVQKKTADPQTRRKETGIIIGNAGAEPVFWPVEHEPYGTLAAFPLPDGRWALTSGSFLAVIDKQRVERVVEIASFPVLRVPGVLVTDSRRRVFRIPDSETPIRRVLEDAVPMTANIAVSRGHLAALTSDLDGKAVLIPSWRIVEQRRAGVIWMFLIGVGDDGYAFPEWEDERRGAMVFHDADGKVRGRIADTPFRPIDVSDIVFVSGFFLVVAWEHADFDPPHKGSTLVTLVSYRPSGEPAGRAGFEGPHGGVSVTKVDEKNGIVHLRVGSWYHSQRFLAMVSDLGKLTVIPVRPEDEG